MEPVDMEHAQLLRQAPRVLLTERTVLLPPHPAQLPVRMAWAAANHEALKFISWWREHAQPEAALRNLHYELHSMATQRELTYNVFERPTWVLTEAQLASLTDAEVQRIHAEAAYVGRLDLHSWDAEVPRCEMGYVADVRTQGRGLLREAARAACKLAWQLGVQRIQAMTDPDNTASIRFAQALGMRLEGVLKAYERNTDGELRDQVMLAMTRPST